MVKRQLACLAGIALFACPVLSMAYYEESLSPGSEGTEIEIVDNGIPPVNTEVTVVDLPPADYPAQRAPVKAPASGKASHASKPSNPLISYVGSGRPVAVSGRGSGLPLNVAVAMMVPKGWDVEDGPLARGKKVSFSAVRKPWTLVLEDMGKQTGTPIVINWKNGTVQVGKRAKVQAPAKTVAASSGGIVRKAVISEPGRADTVARRYKVEVDSFCRWNEVGHGAWLPAGYEVYLEEPPAGTIVVANIPSGPTDPMAGKKLPPVPTTPVAAPAVYTPDTVVEVQELTVRPEFEAEMTSSGYTYALSPGPLYNQLSQWCSAAGFELVWKVDGDYDITSFSAFGQDFRKALVQLFNSLMDSGQPLRATVYERNHVVEVTGD